MKAQENVQVPDALNAPESPDVPGVLNAPDVPDADELRNVLLVKLNYWRQRIKKAKLLKLVGRVKKVVGLTLEVEGIAASIGDVCRIYIPGENNPVKAEVMGFRGSDSLLMPLGELRGIRPGCRVLTDGKPLTVKVGDQLLGQVLDGLGRPLDNAGGTGGEFFSGNLSENLFSQSGMADYPVNNTPPNPLQRKRIDRILSTGVRAIDAFLTCGQGQRMGIFAGSGVGKSVLLGMISRFSDADVNVIALIGERGREVLDFIENDLGQDGLKRSVVVAATSDQPALVRLKGAFVASAIAEYFRDKGKNVLLLMDSVTRFAAAQREVGLAVGEPPATKGYTPSVFALLPRLLERSGNGSAGSITAFYTVLVEGDDMNEPVADAVRSILDGHIVLSRRLAEKNHYPAIDVLQSVSRLMPDIASKEHRQQAGKVRELLATYLQAEDLLNIGAYEHGSNPRIDEAVRLYDGIIGFLRQRPDEHADFEETLAGLASLTK